MSPSFQNRDSNFGEMRDDRPIAWKLAGGSFLILVGHVVWMLFSMFSHPSSGCFTGFGIEALAFLSFCFFWLLTLVAAIFARRTGILWATIGLPMPGIIFLIVLFL